MAFLLLETSDPDALTVVPTHAGVMVREVAVGEAVAIVIAALEKCSEHDIRAVQRALLPAVLQRVRAFGLRDTVATGVMTDEQAAALPPSRPLITGVTDDCPTPLHTRRVSVTGD